MEKVKQERGGEREKEWEEGKRGMGRIKEGNKPKTKEKTNVRGSPSDVRYVSKNGTKLILSFKPSF